ncbi:MAG: metallophosphoesterase, partial [Cyclobacteriaceae bacterium]
MLCWIVTSALATDPGLSTKSAEPPIFTIYLIGDAGEASENGDFATLNFLQKHLQEANNQSAVLFLGDNIYPRGLPDEGHHGYAEAENVLKAYQRILEGYSGRKVFIAGNHDWKKGAKHGWEYAINQESWIIENLDSLIMLPEGGCPGPVELNLNEEVTLIILNTQWILHPWDKPRADEGCGLEHSYEVFGQLDDIILRNREKKIVVAGHHPMYSYGIHGGVTRFKDHIFPLTAANPSLY